MKFTKLSSTNLLESFRFGLGGTTGATCVAVLLTIVCCLAGRFVCTRGEPTGIGVD